MDNVGAEVGQKMRSAIKAKLLELNCYVDDELPDYIMVMVANRRSKAQMNEDLSLFLNTKTSAFVEWLHIVLKKLKEVTVTNPEVYKKVAKKKSSEQIDAKVKKEKSKKSEHVKKETSDIPDSSLRNATHENKNIGEENVNDEFNIPLLSEVNSSSEKDLEEIEAKIKSVKSRLGLMVDSDVEEEVLKIKLETAKSEIAERKENTRQRNVELEFEETSNNSNDKNVDIHEESEETSYTPEKPRRHSPITFEREESSKTPPRKTSVLSRLGKRVSSTSEPDSKKKRLNFSEYRKEDDSNFKRNSSRNTGTERHNSRDERRYRRDRNERDRREGRRSSERMTSRNRRESTGSEEFPTREDKSILSRIGVMSKIHIPEKSPEEEECEEQLRTRAVRSMVKVRPRILPAGAPQPNKNLLLKAVAEAHKSVSEAKLGNVKDPSRRSEDANEDVPITRKLSHREKVKLRNLILAQVSREDSDSDREDKDMEYVPKPIRKRTCRDLPEYVPSSRQSVDDSPEKEKPTIKSRLSAKARLDGKKTPSPIIFSKVSTKVSNRIKVPEALLLIHPPISVKTQERCKYWPNCRQGDKCEFIHSTTTCEMFPNCKYGDKCLYIHPSCKFGAACTKRGCPYSHYISAKSAAKTPVVQPQTCKFFPKCSNIQCPFYHPKLCMFGKFCKNQADCPFSHVTTVNKSSLTWRSK